MTRFWCIKRKKCLEQEPPGTDQTQDFPQDHSRVYKLTQERHSLRLRATDHAAVFLMSWQHWQKRWSMTPLPFVQLQWNWTSSHYGISPAARPYLLHNLHCVVRYQLFFMDPHVHPSRQTRFTLSIRNRCTMVKYSCNVKLPPSISDGLFCSWTKLVWLLCQDKVCSDWAFADCRY